MSAPAEEVGPLLSSVSVMLAAFGVFYTSQREGIEAAIADESFPDSADDTRNLIKRVGHYRVVTAVLSLAALAVWLLLLPEVVDRIDEAADSHFDLGQYSAPDAIFVTAAFVWLLLAGYTASRWWALRGRRQRLDAHLSRRVRAR